MSDDRGTQRDKYPLYPDLQAKACRDLAAKIRDEAANGLDPIQLMGTGAGKLNQISRNEAADSLKRQAERWEAEIATGIPNVIDRRRLGE